MILQYGFGRCRPKEIQAILYSMSIEDADYYVAIRMLIFNLTLYRVIAICLLIWRVNPIENRQKRISRILGQFREKFEPNIGTIPGIETG